MTFELGRVCATRAVAECFNQHTLVDLLHRYCSGDWGNLCDNDKKANVKAIERGGRILARYDVEDETLYVITEADRSYTTILFPYEY
ncbi:TPA: hypothetical protein PXF07_001992 [Mannheimia haemolytica]|uniref:Type I restriction endonuclease subunit M n=5 Tax=Mannheimia haemolytica TaxID=75985 RepID=A0A249A1B1_MANHA|nr:hypothetical protein [Mannheimia haemolytica]AWW71859.1 hypothetical protein C4O86_08775 [Pasteurellaceae bacterium 12565]AGI32931.1 hypothetical protein D650_16620 [Mannheimia haemolytica USDA-ARS-USMARC-183]AGI33104.1 hypothetical protein D650_18350 [Mannheimia haemolytica USDA-ARS-USMARC-183]AGI34927.1 hypothetical protein D648_9230 [Mannheimia haemolytica USDA-ARS-USMARC-185]AGI35097.1 hypothetical protein D648_10930 [Mannheimia haemolytica USDA-ARS-USMARC-185]